MIIDDYRGIRLPISFCETIDNLLTRFEVPDDAKRLVFNFRDPTYYQSRVGLHPVEIQLSRDNDRAPWSLAFIASFSYQDDRQDSLDVELYFHLANRWCYQPDAGTADLAQSEVLDLFCSWCAAFERHIAKHAFRDIQLTLIR
ncbi:DUF2787 domain-containing protein [Vibrio vulnificus]|nr:DUF2787 domain-containing protein [Vibrio vulnificus]ELX4139372.1 DUF2787 domain-containing protein [Vibrio vulnificus]